MTEWLFAGTLAASLLLTTAGLYWSWANRQFGRLREGGTVIFEPGELRAGPPTLAPAVDPPRPTPAGPRPGRPPADRPVR